MSYWLWRILLICIVLGAVQWGYTHPDSQITQFVVKTYHDANTEFWRLEKEVRDFLMEGISFG